MTKKIKIGVITSSRADYGQLRNLIKLMKHDKKIILQLIAIGSHFNKNRGYSFKEIVKDKFKISAKLKLKQSKFGPKDISNYTSETLKGVSKIIIKLKPHMILLLGDRYETFAAASAALFHNIPLVHLHGGEVTSGVIDEPIRHSITKMSDIHFVANNIFKKRIRRMGEKEKNIFNVGSLTAENVKSFKKKGKNEIEKKFNFKFKKKNFIVTLHPEKEFKNTKRLVKNTLAAMRFLPKDCLLIFTSSNIDKDSNFILKEIKKFNNYNSNSIFIPNFGYENYLSCIHICDGVIGNSSSGITEAPLLRKMVINIGDRQKGRPLSSNIIQCGYKIEEIKESFFNLLSKKKKIGIIKSYYYRKNTKNEILRVIKKINLKNIKEKKFVD